MVEAGDEGVAKLNGRQAMIQGLLPIDKLGFGGAHNHNIVDVERGNVDLGAKGVPDVFTDIICTDGFYSGSKEAFGGFAVRIGVGCA